MLLSFSLLASAQNEEKITIPKGIVYRYCDKEIVDKARQMIKTDLADSSAYHLCGKLMIVGPVLWARFKKLEALAAIQGGNTTFMVDKDKLSGKMTQDVEDTKKVWSALRKEVNGQDYSIRKLNEKELAYYWSVISFDIDEPLLIVETKEHKYILNILKDSMELMWLDESPL